MHMKIEKESITFSKVVWADNKDNAIQLAINKVHQDSAIYRRHL